jgi:ABC-type uncharacterized transport system permease subunit
MGRKALIGTFHPIPVIVQALYLGIFRHGGNPINLVVVM